MRKSNNYYKFMEYVSYGKRCDDTICKDNGVLECTSYCTVSDIEYYENVTLGVENDWLKIKNVLVNEEVIDVYYVKGERMFYIATFILDNFKTQKELKHAIHKAVDNFFINNVDIIKDTETSETAESKEIEEATEDHDEYVEISDSKESTDSGRINYLMETHSFPSISDMYNDKCFCCPADRKGNECKGKETCGKTWKRYEAITNPEWHHVSLATIASIDFDMLDEKRQVYLNAHRELKRTLADLSKCKTGHTYEARARKFFRDMKSKYYRNKISHEMRKYLDLQISMSNVINGVWSSYVEPAMGLHESRRYSRTTLTY